MYVQGDRVVVRGFGGREAVLRVWEQIGCGVFLCSEAGYERMWQGGDPEVIGFPLSDIQGYAPSDETAPVIESGQHTVRHDDG
jgi:hypothetical protein